MTTDIPQVTAADVRDLLSAPHERPVLYIQNGPDDGTGELSVRVWAEAEGLVHSASVIASREEIVDLLGENPDGDTIEECLPGLQEDVDNVAAKLEGNR